MTVNKTNRTSATTATNPIFNVVTETTLTKDEELELYYNASIFKEIKNLIEKSETKYVNASSSYVCIKTDKQVNYSRLFGILSIDTEYEWTTGYSTRGYRYLILDKINFDKIKKVYNEYIKAIKVPGFIIKDGSMIFGYEIEDVQNKNFYQIFGSKMSKTLSLFFSDNMMFRDRLVIKPIYYINESNKEKFIEKYDKLDLYNEQTLQTILRTIEELLFDDEDEDDDWI